MNQINKFQLISKNYREILKPVAWDCSQLVNKTQQLFAVTNWKQLAPQICTAASTMNRSNCEQSKLFAVSNCKQLLCFFNPFAVRTTPNYRFENFTLTFENKLKLILFDSFC